MIDNQGKKQLKSISKQEEQLKKIKGKKKLIKKIEKGEKSRNIMLLEDNQNDIMMNFDMNLTSEEKNIIKKAATVERMIY